MHKLLPITQLHQPQILLKVTTKFFTMKKITVLFIWIIIITIALQAQVSDSLILYCTFDDVNSITNPVVGPGGTFNANPETNFTTGQVGNAYIANYTEDKLVFFPKEVIPPTRGCIELWARLTDMPEYILWWDNPALFHAYQNNPITGDPEYLIMFNGNDGFGGAGLTARAGSGAANNFAGASSTGCWWYDYTFASILGDVNAWHHYALVWDISGVTGSQYKMQIYLDGIPIGESGPTCDTGDDRSPVKFDGLSSGALYIINFRSMTQGSVTIDELKIWDYPKTQFIDEAYIFTVLDDQLTCTNDNAVFEVKAVGIPPIHYQWQKDGKDITGATDSVLIINNVQNEDSGNYRCIASNDYGTDTSNTAMLTVEIVAPDSLILYCTFDDVNSITNPVTGPGGTFNANPETNFITGQVGNAYVANYMEDKLVFFPKEVVPAKRGCIELWARLFDMPYFITWGASPALFGPMSWDIWPRYNIQFNGNTGLGGAGLAGCAGNGEVATNCWWYDYSYSSIIGDVNAWHHYALSWDMCGVPGSQNSIQIYLDGIPLEASMIDCDGGNHTPTAFDAITDDFFIICFQFVEQGSAAVDELKIWNYPKTQFIDQAYIYTVLNDQQICKNESATLEVKAVGVPPLHYQWQKDGVDISGATDSVLTISRVQPEDKGEYRCIASNSYGIDTSNSAMLWVEFGEPTDIQGFTYIPEYQVATYSVEIQQGHTYEFIVEGGNKIDSTGNSVTVHWGKPGQGYVKLIETSDIGCYAETNTLNVTIGSTGIKDQLIQNLIIYPNPVKDNLIIKFNDATLSDITISIVDISGRSIVKRSFENIGLNAERTLDLSFIKSGIYFLEIRGEKNSRVYKIIKE
jgi:hypothetical protein